MPVRQGRTARLAGLSLACLLAWPIPGGAETAPLFRLFLNNGTVVTCLGEYARVGDRVVFTMPVGDSSQLLSLPGTSWIWARTEQYTDSFRADQIRRDARRGRFLGAGRPGGRGAQRDRDHQRPGRKLQLALDARRRLSAGRVTTTTTKPTTSGKSSSSWTRPSRRCARPPASSSSISASRPTFSRPRCRCCPSPPSPSRWLAPPRSWT